MSMRVWAEIVAEEPFLRLLGLTIGDCRTLRVVRGFCKDFLLVFLEREIELAGAECESRFMSMGEFVDPDSRWSYIDGCSFCACRAGELKGLKYAPGTVYSGILKWASRGVTAGETSGVKAICLDKSAVYATSCLFQRQTSCSFTCI